MQIDVVSDTVCPWCFIGKRRLERALEMRPAIDFDVRWRAYRLDPTVPVEGIDRKAYLRAKFGDSPRTQAMGEAIRAAGTSEKIAFAFDRIARTPNTLDSHRLIRWAESAGAQDQVVELLFKAYFEEGKDVGNRGVLLSVAEAAGMDTALVADLLSQEADRSIVEREDALAHEMGISGVPTFIFANKYLISGAQDPETIVKVIDRTAELAAAG
ncbi:MAG: DsbA family oxidoreductase [Proteobacteria bacterium]|nr:DsbA family oxidoreductase [Pseudomonadota bacterium]